MGVTFSLAGDSCLVPILILTNQPCVLCVKDLWQIHWMIKSLSPDTNMLPLIYPSCPRVQSFCFRSLQSWHCMKNEVINCSVCKHFTVFYKMQTTEHLADLWCPSFFVVGGIKGALEIFFVDIFTLMLLYYICFCSDIQLAYLSSRHNQKCLLPPWF